MKTISKKPAAQKRRKLLKKRRPSEARVIKPYFSFFPPDEPERYELDELLQIALVWHESESARMKKAASAGLRLFGNLEKQGC